MTTREQIIAAAKEAAWPRCCGDWEGDEMKWIYPTTWAILTVVLIYMDKGSDALGACFASVLSAMACFVKEFDE
jgi:hypothetical protein